MNNYMDIIKYIDFDAIVTSLKRMKKENLGVGSVVNVFALQTRR